MLKVPSLTLAALTLLAAEQASAQCVLTATGPGQQCQTLYAGQTIDAGQVCVEVVNTDLVVTYTTSGGWELTEAHLWVGDDIANMPQTRKGNPKVGNFPYHSGDITGQTTYTFTVPLVNLGFACPGSPDTDYYVAAHAALRKSDGAGGYQTETGWADGDRFVEKGNWGTYFTVTLSCNCGGGGGGGGSDCETAFANGGSFGTCFLDIDEDGDSNGDFNRWGWTNFIGQGTVYSFPIYGGAGQCDTTKGALVGTLSVDTTDPSQVLVTYTATTGWHFEEVHVYVGSEILPRNPTTGEFTVAPGQYTLVLDDVIDPYQVSAGLQNPGGEFYLIAHAVACQG